MLEEDKYQGPENINPRSVKEKIYKVEFGVSKFPVVDVIREPVKNVLGDFFR